MLVKNKVIKKVNKEIQLVPGFIDFETQSTQDIKEVGGDKYLQHPDTQLLSLVLLVGNDLLIYMREDNSPPFRFNPYNLEHELIDHKKYNITFVRSNEIPEILHTMLKRICFLVAHNAPFDQGCWDKFIKIEGIKWFDTLPRAKAGGYPGDLDKLGLILTGYGKDEGEKAMRMLTKIPIRNGKKQIPMGTKVLWESLLQYNIIDVLNLEIIFDKVKDFGEPEIIDIDRRINQRGIYIDKQLVAKLFQLYTYNEVKAKSQWDLLTDEANPRSPQQVKDWLASKGYRVETLNKQILQGFFNNPEHYETNEYEYTEENLDRKKVEESVIEALKLRQQIARTGKGKLERMLTLKQAESDIITNQLVIYHAITGRFGSRGLQIHNFARGRDFIDLKWLLDRKEKLTLRDILRQAEKASQQAVEKGQLPVTVADVLNTLTRSCIKARKGKILGIADYGQIEARCVAWLAGETSLLKQFAAREDVYSIMASKIFGVPLEEVTKEQRYIGKTVVLACGYSMSAGKFDANCRIVYNINLENAGTSAEDCVNTYRKTYQKICGNPRSRTGIWQKYHDAAHACIAYGEEVEVGPVRFKYQDNTMSIRLPSGRHIYYRGAHIADRIPSYCKTLGLEPILVPTIVYSHPHGYEGSLYGGLITENISQGMSRDILVDGIRRLEEYGIPTIMHVHDEDVSELERKRQIHDQCRILSTAPSWCPDFPLLVEGFTCPYYTKTPFSKDDKVEYLCGKEVTKA